MFLQADAFWYRHHAHAFSTVYTPSSKSLASKRRLKCIKENGDKDGPRFITSFKDRQIIINEYMVSSTSNRISSLRLSSITPGMAVIARFLFYMKLSGIYLILIRSIFTEICRRNNALWISLQMAKNRNNAFRDWGSRTRKKSDQQIAICILAAGWPICLLEEA